MLGLIGLGDGLHECCGVTVIKCTIESKLLE